MCGLLLQLEANAAPGTPEQTGSYIPLWPLELGERMVFAAGSERAVGVGDGENLGLFAHRTRWRTTSHLRHHYRFICSWPSFDT